MRALIIPGTPLLLTGVDPEEPNDMVRLRSAVRTRLRAAPVHIDAAGSLPPVVGLGGLGIDRSIDPRSGAVHSGPEHREAWSRLSSVQRAHALGIPTATTVALLTAAEAGCQAHIAGPGAQDGAAAAPPEFGARHGSAPIRLLPSDFSAAAHADGPLAPRPGAADFDASVERALMDGDSESLSQLRQLLVTAPAYAADFSHLARFLDEHRPRSWSARMIAASDVHRVRYRVIELDCR